MAGKIKRMIDEIIEKRSRGNTAIAHAMRTKLIMKGIDCAKYTSTSDDDPEVIKKLEEISRALM